MIIRFFSHSVVQPSRKVRIDLNGDYMCKEQRQPYFQPAKYEREGIFQFSVCDFQMYNRLLHYLV
jgi:hypothetical protein